MRHVFAALALAAGLAVAPVVTRAAEPMFPAGGAVGIAPPSEMTPSHAFAGFEHKDSGSSIVISELPAEAYQQLVESFTPDALKARGVDAAGPAEDLALAAGAKAKLIRGSQEQNGVAIRRWIVIASNDAVTAVVTVQSPRTAALAEADVEAALKTVAFRAPQAIGDQIAALPFAIGDMAGFRAVRVIGGSGVYLTDGPKDVIDDGSQPFVVVAASLGKMPPPDARDAFAKKAFEQLNGVSGLETTSATLDGGSLSRIEGRGTDPKSALPMYVTQTIRFEDERYVRVVALARETEKDKFAERFDTLAKSVTAK